MKDCATCDDRVELNPKYKRMKWENLPCSKCRNTEPMNAKEKRTISIDAVDRNELERAMQRGLWRRP